MFSLGSGGRRPTEKMLIAIAEHRQRVKNGERPDLEGAVYHGGCLRCMWMKDNDTRAGVDWCLGCMYSNFNQNLPDRSLKLDRYYDMSEDEKDYLTSC